LQALEASRDFHSRSNLDAIRRHTCALLEDQDDDNFKWNDITFLRTIKSVAQDGDIDLCTNILAELSPSYKRKRADSLSQRMSIVLEPEVPPPDCVGDVSKQDHHYKPGCPKIVAKEPPHRPSEHDKWKFIPKKIYDKAVFE
jgi:hypothetical protein